jgi:hypothetical protein
MNTKIILRHFFVAFIFLMSSLLVLSCEKYLEFEGEYKTPKIVVNSKITSDSTFKVHLSRSLNIVDNGELSSITDASVSILDGNDNLIETLVYDAEGFYLGSNSPLTNQTYKIRVSAPSYTPVSSQTYIPNDVTIISVDTSSYVSTEGDTLFKLKIVFADNGSFDDFYQIRLGYGYFVSGQLYYNPVSLTSNDVSLGLEQDEFVDFASFTDELFNGSTKTLEVSCNNFSSYYDYLQINIITASKDVYLYDRTLATYSQNNGGFFSEPVQVYTNITNGFGIFGGYQTTRFKINF